MEYSVRDDLCVGCGLCAGYCPSGAIIFLLGKARIDGEKCSHCGLCRDICPRGAIVERVPLSEDELEATVSSLKRQANELLERIESIRRSR